MKNDYSAFISDPRIFGLVNEAAKKHKLVAPYNLANTLNKFFSVITPDNLPIETIFGSFSRYSFSELVTLTLNRAGYDGTRQSLDNSSILVVYAMMLNGIVSVIDSEHDTKYYTLDPMLAKGYSGVEELPSIKENETFVSKDSVQCYKLSQNKADSAMFRLDTDSQIVTFLASALFIRDIYLNKLQNGVYMIEYFDKKNNKLSRLETTLLKERLWLTNEERLLPDTVHDSKILSLFLPNLKNPDADTRTEIFIPSILTFSCATEKKI